MFVRFMHALYPHVQHIRNSGLDREKKKKDRTFDLLVSGGSWDGEFDKTDLEATLTSNTELPEINPSETSLSNEDSTTMKKRRMTWIMIGSLVHSDHIVLFWFSV